MYQAEAVRLHARPVTTADLARMAIWPIRIVTWVVFFLEAREPVRLSRHHHLHRLMASSAMECCRWRPETKSKKPEDQHCNRGYNCGPVAVHPHVPCALVQGHARHRRFVRLPTTSAPPRAPPNPARSGGDAKSLVTPHKVSRVAKRSPRKYSTVRFGVGTDTSE